ncbi:hypothetical protein SASPL_128755 [Salvia splendens]|uniref:Uncharacterized protein n=1 Tax=Salvia splendens TaxID=180675 RepID=A0A8X8XED9_SALSN|nr:uncharacterized protein LOC121753327 [Salvia splendens]KAG6410690.1 hypothetical protein SASPL_128755 [Salvia splendens]
MRRILAGKKILNRIPCPNRSFCSAPGNNKPTSTGGGATRDGSTSSSSSPSLSKYDEQYKALEDLDFVKAAKILFSDPPKKKKFGLDFHLVQLFFACLPSLAVYLVAQYARGEMKIMDAALEKKKQAEFEAQAKEMELKAAEQKALVASNPEILEVKERLDKLEVTLKDLVTNSKKPADDATKTGGEDQIEQKQAAQPNESVGKTSKEKRTVVSEGNASGLAPDIRPLQSNQNSIKK